MNEPLFVAFSTQKGGAGKTTLTVLMASYFHYVKGYNVAVIDCDFPQFSIKDLRERDLKNVENNPYLKKIAFEQFKRLNKRAYPVLESRPEEAIHTAKRLLASETPPEIIFFDLPGTINNLGVIKTIATMDYIFCPIAADRIVMESSLKFAGIVNDTLVSTGQSNIKGLYLLWNMVDGREKTNLYKVYETIAAEMGIQVMKTFLPDSKRFRKEGSVDEDRVLFRSTILPPDRILAKGSNINKLAEEMLTLLKQ
ncbi:ParA family protein [Bacteroides graminisolvens]|uniref:ParA family protein n=1 Tax=Bacteroides graminisolvens TaxID=477666 RepID=UPI00240A56A4|nr:ParA family protein [Bacteroides graminisolvens]